MDFSNITNQNGHCKIAAIDHRGSIKDYIDVGDILQFKRACAVNFKDHITAILVDREYGNAARDFSIHNGIGVIWTAEKSGYTENDNIRVTAIYDDFDPVQERESLKISATKLLLYYNSQSSNIEAQLSIARYVYAKSKEADLPLIIEPITYQIPGLMYDKGNEIISAVNALKDCSDVLKLEFPIDMNEHTVDPSIEQARPILSQFTSLSDKPWVLLSRGMPFETYKKALIAAKESGAKGYAVGRAVWQDLKDLKTWDEQENFIKTTGVERMKQLSEIF